uniref:Uncharacterized protein n=1 Tax=Rhizophora mucronata TaxID=61149 RepID=A0A2P2NPP0_RHIMU
MGIIVDLTASRKLGQFQTQVG